MKPPFRHLVIDCHCHAGKGNGLTGPWDTAAPLDQHMKRADAAGIHRTVLFPTLGGDYVTANAQVASIVRAHPGRCVGFAFVHAEQDRGHIFRMVKTAVDRYGFRGIKVHRLDAPISREICDTARALRLPVLYDVVGRVSSVRLLATEYPDVDFIIPHLGSFADDWSAQVAMIDHLVHYPNIYTDTSGVRSFDLLLEAVQRAGAHKILFGSDGPWLHPRVEIAKVHALDLPTSDARLVLGGNILRLMSRRRRASRFPENGSMPPIRVGLR